MFESETFEAIMERCLALVSGDVDKREGSIIYDTLAPAVLELANAYISMDIILDEAFADTASREYLIRRASERGLTPYSATYASVSAVFNTAVPLGSRFNLGTINYAVSELTDDTTHTYRLTCESAGEAGNIASGQLTPIDYIEGLTSAQITGIVTAAVEAEDTEVFRRRYFDSLDMQAFGGNIADYRQKLQALNNDNEVIALGGIGQIRVYTADEWNGGGTVKVVFTTAADGLADSELIDRVQNYIDPANDSGKGYGIAPVGHRVTVATVNADEVTIDLGVTIEGNTTVSDATGIIRGNIEAYFKTINSAWEENQTAEDYGYIANIDVNTLISAAQGTGITVRSVAINNETQGIGGSYALSNRDSFAMLGTLNITEV